MFTVANVAIDYLVNHSSEDISDVTVAFLDLENVDFDIPYAILRTFRNNLLGILLPSGNLQFYGSKVGTQNINLRVKSYHTIRYDTIEEFNVDSKAEYTA